MADALIYNLSTKNDYLESVATRKEVVYVQDQNGGSYNGTINIETSSISNSGKFQDLSSAWFTIPYVVSFQAPANLNTEFSRLSLGLKSGYWNILHSFSCDWNGVNICQLTPFINIYCSYKAMTSWSVNDLWKNGEAVGFWKDSVDSMYYNNAAAAGGVGVCNNLVQQVGLVAAAAGGVQQSGGAIINWDAQTMRYGFNEGFLKRMLNTANMGQGAANSLAASNQFMSLAELSNCGYSFHGRTAADGIYYWRYNAVIRLKDLSDFFEKVPLCKGGVLRFTLNYNSCTQTITCAAALGSLTPSLTVLTSGQTVPYIFANNEVNNPNASLGNRILPIVAGVNTSIAGSTAGSFNSARLYVPLYNLHPSYEEQLLSLNPVKTIQYKDIYEYTLTGTAANGSFNALITNGLVRPMSVIICPFISTQINGVANITSPFSSAPATVDPLLAVRSFNIQVSGVNLFQQNIDYSFQEFQQELSRMSAVNGNVTTGLTSGLISQHDYERGYGYVVADCSRSYSFDDIVPKSILISGINASASAVTYYVFVEYMRTVNINLASGNISL